MKIIWKTAQNISIKSIFYDIQAYSVSPRGGIKKRQSSHRGFYTHRNSALSKRRRPTLPLAQDPRRGGA